MLKVEGPSQNIPGKLKIPHIKVDNLRQNQGCIECHTKHFDGSFAPSLSVRSIDSTRYHPLSPGS